MRKLVVVMSIVAWFGVSVYANTCEQKERLGLNYAELNFIVGMMDSSLFNGAFLISLYSPYKNMAYDEQDFLKKAKERQKTAFAKKDLKWNEDNIRSEMSKARKSYKKAEADCEAKQKKSVLD